jgi:hypothetical protein
MDKKTVEQQFKVLMLIERELGIVGKSSFVDTIYLLIKFMEIKNPFGTVNDKIEELNENFSQICVCLKMGCIGAAAETVENELVVKGWCNLFMHSMKASVAMNIIEDPEENELHPSGSLLTRHNFGSGLYCFWHDFTSDLLAALSFAVDWSFLFENPCIIAFPKPHCNIDSGIVNVNHTAINEMKLKHLLFEDQYVELNNARHWEGETKNWKTMVAIA